MTSIVMCTAGGEQHGLINTLTNSVPFDDFKNFSPANKAKMEKEKKEDARLVKVEYINSRGRNERLTKHYCRYAGDPIQQWHLIPGFTYEVPFGFVKEVNNSGKSVKRSGLLTVDGENVTKDGSPLAEDMEGERLHRLVPIAF